MCLYYCRKTSSSSGQQRVSPPLGFDMVRRATASQMEQARELLELQQKKGVPLFGKGSGRGRKK